MKDPVNLNRVRKAKARADKQKQAGENRIRFGRTTAEKSRAGAQVKKADKELDNHRLNDDE
jgi:hypothetical protein